jgi:hypothetical protein
MASIIRRFISPASGTSASAHAAHGTEIHWMPAGRAAPEVVAGVPSVHAAWNGSYPLCVDGHSLKLEEEVFLALNAGHVLTTRGRRDAGSCMLSIYFAPPLLTQAFDALTPVDRELLIAGTQNGTLRLFEHLRDCDRSLISVMHYVAHHICAGVEDVQWYEEQVSFLLRRLLTHELSLARSVAGMTHMKSWKRRETFTRLARVTDLIHSCYNRELALSYDARIQSSARHQPLRISATSTHTNGCSPAVLDGIVCRGNRGAHRFPRTQHAGATLASQPRTRRARTTHARARRTNSNITASGATQNANVRRIRCESRN